MREPIGIPITGGQTYTVSSGVRRILALDAAGNEIEVLETKAGTFALPESAKYIKFSSIAKPVNKNRKERRQDLRGK